MAKGCRQTRVHLINLITELWISRIYWWLCAALFPPPGALLRALLQILTTGLDVDSGGSGTDEVLIL